MRVNTITVGKLQVKNNIFLAPIAGYTDYCIRHLQLKLGVGLTFSELVSAKGLMFGGVGSKELLYSGADIKGTAVQLFGSDPYFMRAACESEYLKDFEIVDINMGCPVPKLFKNGEGSALLTDVKKAESIVSACVKSGKTVTIKIRTGQKYGDDVASEFAKMAESVGASLITVHGRVREAYYSGEIDFKAIERAKNSVKIPVIANGGIFTEEDADLVLQRTGADGVMLARGALCNPFLVNKLLKTSPALTLKEYMIEHVKLMASRYNEKKAALEFRKFTPYYFKGMTGVKELKTKIQQAERVDDLLDLITKNL